MCAPVVNAPRDVRCGCAFDAGERGKHGRDSGTRKVKGVTPSTLIAELALASKKKDKTSFKRRG